MKNKLFTIKNIIRILFFIFLFITKSYSQQNNKLINEFLVSEVEKNKWLLTDINDWVLTDQYTDQTTGLTHSYIQQRHNGIIVYNAISNFIIKDGKVLYFKSGFIDHLENKVNAEQAKLNPESAFSSTLTHLGKGKSSLRSINKNAAKNLFEYESPEISDAPVKIQLVYRQTVKGVLLSWDVSLKIKDESHWWNVRTDALTGEFIDKNDFTVECNFSAVSSDGSLDFTDYGSLLPPPVIPDYNVFVYPLEGPSFGNRTLITDPSSPSASPFGWHDVDGISGAEYTITRGNNVYAYEDANNDNLPGYSPNGGANLHFDFPYTANAVPTTNQDASLSNLFYNNNAIHDYLYPLGFTEAAGNFQQNNYGNGGVGGDYIKAEGFDGSGTSNANFNTQPDGISGRMQMFLWTGVCSSLNITSSIFNGSLSIGSAAFSSFSNVTANLILVNDGVGTVTDACSAIANIAGKIALIDRGSCTFVSKAQVAQAAGAVGVIIVNNAAGGPPGMSGTPTLTIPCVSVTLADGNMLKSALLSGTVVATINTCNTANQIDGSFDNGIVSHEYGHGVSTRLTGGPSQAGCLGNAEQGGEGWSDWLALMMTIEPGDQGSNARGIGTFVLGQPTNGWGIRRYPYSTNMSINPQTYGNLAVNSEVHAIGEIWCDAIWDMSWFLIDQYGFSANPNNASAGNNIAIRLVLEGMKLQPCGPGYLDARDAILTADAVLYNNAHRCKIWEAFARRGMGYNAIQGSANVVGDETENFVLPPYCQPVTQAPVAAFTSDLSSVLCGGDVKFTDQSVQPFEWFWEFGDQTTSTSQNPVHTFTSPGIYAVKLTVTNPLGSNFIVHNITVNPAFSVNVTATPSSLCQTGAVQLNAIASGTASRTYSLSNIAFAPVAGTGTTVTLKDDTVSGAFPIGFTFNFFGLQNYTNFYISSNGLITFSPGMPATPVYGVAIPSAADPDNFIALAWNDLNPANAGSTISYFTTGTTPNRKLVVKYNTSHYGGTSFPFVVQAILYEGTNVIEIHTTTISNVSSYDPSATTTQGVENLKGSAGVSVPGRNGVIFSATNDAYRFSPVIQYSYKWLPGNLNGPVQTVNPISNTIYTVQVSDGSSCLASFNTTVTINTPPSVSANSNSPVCAGSTINLTSSGGVSYSWTGANGFISSLQNPIKTNASAANAGAYTVIVTDANGCTASASTNVAVNTGAGVSCNSITLNLKLFIQGFYVGGNSLIAVVDPINYPTLCDTIIVELRNGTSPFNLAFSKKGVIDIGGNGQFVFPPAVLNETYYIVIKHRNSIDTWSKLPVLFNNQQISFDFTRQ